MKKEHLTPYLNKTVYAYDIMGGYVKGILTDMDDETITLVKGSITSIINLDFIAKVVNMKEKNEK